MAGRYDCDICVIGAGAAGLTVAAGASQMGASVVLVEAGKMGGECLNTGCVPSKALLAAAGEGLDFAAAHKRVRDAIAAIAPHDSQARFEGLGVRVISARASFTSPRELKAGEAMVRARRYVIATGSRPVVPPIAGLDTVPALTNETLFGAPLAPEHLLILGAGPVGVEMAQAWRRLGASVTLIEQAHFLPNTDPELAGVVRAALEADGVKVVERASVTSAQSGREGITLEGSAADTAFSASGSHLLLATGRAPVIEGLGLEAAGVAVGERGIRVDGHMRTSNRRIYAAGDVTGPARLTHMASYQAGIVLRHALFRLPAKARYDRTPQVIYTDPEFASVGLRESEARARGLRINILRASFAENDRAIIEGRGDGHIKVITNRSGRVLGAGIVGARAGELIQTWSLALDRGLSVKTVAGLIAPYPSYGELNVAAARSYFAPKLFSARTRGLVRFLRRLG